MNWKLGQLLYISDWSKFVGPILGFILDQTHCIWVYWVTGFILAIGLARMTINTIYTILTSYHLNSCKKTNENVISVLIFYILACKNINMRCENNTTQNKMYILIIDFK